MVQHDTLQDIGSMHGKEEWDAQWHRLHGESRWFGKLLGWLREKLVIGEVAAQTDRWFAPEGIFVGAGCGTSEDGLALGRAGRRLVGMDFSQKALGLAKKAGAMRHLICGDLSSIPLKTNSVAGMWNWGVMEHFPEPVLQQVLGECARALRPGGRCVFFWPWAFGPAAIFLGVVNWMRATFLGKKEELYIPEYSRLRSKRHAEQLLQPIFGKCHVRYSWRTGLIVLVAVGEKA